MRRVTVLSIIFLLVVLFGVVLALHRQGLDARMCYDSAVRIAGARMVYESQGLTGALGIFPQRPIPMLSFYMNYLLAGMSPAWFRIFNFLLLSATAVVVMALTELILTLPASRWRDNPRAARLAGIAAGLIFLVHPLQTFLTLYIWQRMALLACLFSYSALAVYIATRSGATGNRPVGYAACLCLGICAILSKENSVVLPGALILAEIAFFRASLKVLIKRAVFLALALAVALAAVSMLQHPHGVSDYGTGILPTISRYYEESGLTAKEVALTQCRVYWQYALMVLAPLPSTALLINPQTISVSLFDPPNTLPSVIGLFASIALGLILLKRKPIAAFGILFFAMTALPESLLVPQYSFLGYRPVLPMFGILLVVVDLSLTCLAAAWRSGLSRVGGATAAVVLASWIGLAAWTCTVRAEIWSNPEMLWGEAVRRLPDAPVKLEKFAPTHALHNYGLALQRAGKHLQAVQVFRRSLAIDPARANTLSALGVSLIRLGELDRAEESFRRALKLDPDNPAILSNVGELRLAQGKPGEALDILRAAVRSAPSSHEINGALAIALWKTGDRDRAIDYFRRAFELNPLYSAWAYNLGKSLLDTGRIEESITYLRKTIELDPNYWQAYNNLGAAYAMSGNADKALAAFRHALRINPDDPATRQNLATALKQFGSAR